jgi:hypothetical protein
MVPESGVCLPDNIFNKVDFPAPFLPVKPTLSFLFTKNETSSNKYVPLKLTDTLLTDNMFGLINIRVI